MPAGLRPSRLTEARRRAESRLSNLLGKPVGVLQLTVFAMPCGCVGVSLETRNLVREDVEVFESKLRELLSSLARGILGKKPNVYYARLAPSRYDVVSVTGRIACDECRKELEGAADLLTF